MELHALDKLVLLLGWICDYKSACKQEAHMQKARQYFFIDTDSR